MTTPVPSCECQEDGFCQRYQRHMGGRFREICAGVNIDPGTAAVFREDWAREAGTRASDDRIPLVLITEQAPGDAVCMTAGIHSLHRSHLGKYLTAVKSPYPEVFAYNPDVVDVDDMPRTPTEIRMHYPAIHHSNARAIHFMQGWCEFLSSALGVHVPLVTNRPHLYFNTPEPQRENFWVVCSGGKDDFTAKRWHGYQEVVSVLKGAVRFVQVGNKGDDHPPLEGAESMVGKTTLRQLFDLVRRAKGVLCGVSLLMHVAAALEKPAVVIAGGREPVAWNAYPKQQYVHTIGALPCRDGKGKVGEACWHTRTVVVGDGSGFDTDLCERPHALGTAVYPQCMLMIDPVSVARLIVNYNVPELASRTRLGR